MPSSAARTSLAAAFCLLVLCALPLAAYSGLVGGEWGVPSALSLPAALRIGLVAGAVFFAAAVAWLSGGWRVRLLAGPLGWVLVTVFAGVAWFARSATLVYGDGLTLVSSLLDRAPLPPFEPLAQALHALMFGLWRTFGAQARVDTAWDAISAVSVLCGVLAVLVLAWIARRASDDDAVATPARVLLPALVLAQGHAVLFFGHAENYAPAMTVLLVYVACALQALRSSRFVTIAGAALACACLCHAMAVTLVPSYLALLWLTRAGRPAWRIVLDGLLPAFLLIAGHALLLRQGPGVSLLPWFRAGTALGASGTAAAFARGAGMRAFIPFLDGAMLTGPFTLGAAAAACLWSARRAASDGTVLFALLAMLPAVALWGFGIGESNLGYARNWDVVAPLSLIVMTSACVIAARSTSERFMRVAGTAVLVVSLVHTFTWVAVCADEPATLARFERLPLTAGERASTLGLWAAMKGDEEGARRRWLDGLASEPDNVRLLMFLGRLGLQQQDVGLALASFTHASRVRPDLVAPLAGEVLVLLRAQHGAEARRAIERHARAHPSSSARDKVVAALGGSLPAIGTLAPSAAQWRALDRMTRLAR